MSAVPAGWPDDLPPAGSGFDEKVTGWLLDRLPPQYRTSSVRHQPQVLAMAAVAHAESTLQGTREVYRNLRSQLREELEAYQIDQALEALEALAADLTRTVREVRLVQQALAGHEWRPRL